MFQALYRKWRPRTFDEVIGQAHVTETLKNQVASDRLSHAYLFVGSRGTGKTTCARILARAVNCLNPVDGNPCGECAACKAILSGSAPELVEIDAASNNGVDDVRSLRDEAIYSPASLKKRVYIIDEVHMLSKPAFNALLKILEEPPEHLLFILATTEINKVPATILSRCQRYSFRRIANDDICAYLEKVALNEKLNLSHCAASLIAGLSEGGMRDALSLLDQCSSADVIDEDYVMSVLGLSGGLAIKKLFDAVMAGDTYSAISVFSELWSDGKDPASVLRELSSFMRDLLISLSVGESAVKLISGRYDYQLLAEASAGLSISDICSRMELIQKHLNLMRDSASPRQAAELCLVSLCIGETSVTVSQPVSVKAAAQPAAVPQKSQAASAPASSVQTAAPVKAAEPVAVTEPASVKQESSAASQSEIAAPSPETLSQADAAAGSSEPGWNEAIAVIEPVLPALIKSFIHDSDKVSGKFNGNVLSVSVYDSFFFGRMNNPAVIKNVEKVLNEKYGASFRVIVSEEKAESKAKRDINELREFDNLKFE